MIPAFFVFWAIFRRTKEDDEEMSFRPSLIKPPVSWVGNKAPILPIIYSLFPLEYGRFVEVFGGSGSVLLGKPPDPFEVYNDFDRNLTNLFHCMKARPSGSMTFIPAGIRSMPRLSGRGTAGGPRSLANPMG